MYTYEIKNRLLDLCNENCIFFTGYFDLLYLYDGDKQKKLKFSMKTAVRIWRGRSNAFQYPEDLF